MQNTSHSVYQFQSTRPGWGEAAPQLPVGGRICHFNPLAPGGARPPCQSSCGIFSIFQSTRPGWGEAARHDKVVHRRIISIHSPRVGRGFVKVVVGNFEKISIHSPRVGRGNGVFDDVYLHADFNPLAPGGARQRHGSPSASGGKFQSTRPGWGEAPRHAPPACRRYFNPLAPGGARHDRISAGTLAVDISIHSPRVGRGSRGIQGNEPHQDFNPLAPGGARPSSDPACCSTDEFQSTRPGWGEAYAPEGVAAGTVVISIHSPRVGRGGNARLPLHVRQISIHSPRVGRGKALTALEVDDDISIHSPRVGRGRERPLRAHRKHISIHSPRVGRGRLLLGCIRTCGISIHSPRVGRGIASAAPLPVSQISIHSPRVGRGSMSSSISFAALIFQSTRPGWGEAKAARGKTATHRDFNPLAPGGARRLKAGNIRIGEKFQSTRPGWGEAQMHRRKTKRPSYFNPLAPGGARR